MIRSLASFLLAFVSSLLVAQTAPNASRQSGPSQAPQVATNMSVTAPVVLGAVRSFHPISKGIEVESENGRLQITALQDDVIRVRATRGSEFPAKYSYALLPSPAGSQSSATVKTQEESDAIAFDTAALRVRVDRRNSLVSFMGTDGILIARDAAPI